MKLEDNSEDFATAARVPPVAAHGERLLLVAASETSLAGLRPFLDEAGYTVDAVLSIEAARQALSQGGPELVVLEADAVEPTLSGVPQLLIGPLLRPADVLARIAALLPRRPQTRTALDAFGHASTAVREADGRCLWQSPLARALMAAYFNGQDFAKGRLPPELLLWLHREALRRRAGAAPADLTVLPQWPAGQRPKPGSSAAAAATLARNARRLTFVLHEADAEAYGDGQWLIVMHEADDAASLSSLMQSFGLTQSEAGLLHSLAKGRDEQALVALLGSSTAEVRSQLQALFGKLGVSTAAAAATLARSRLPRLA